MLKEEEKAEGLTKKDIALGILRQYSTSGRTGSLSQCMRSLMDTFFSVNSDPKVVHGIFEPVFSIRSYENKEGGEAYFLTNSYLPMVDLAKGLGKQKWMSLTDFFNPNISFMVHDTTRRGKIGEIPFFWDFMKTKIHVGVVAELVEFLFQIYPLYELYQYYNAEKNSFDFEKARLRVDQIFDEKLYESAIRLVNLAISQEATQMGTPFMNPLYSLLTENPSSPKYPPVCSLVKLEGMAESGPSTEQARCVLENNPYAAKNFILYAIRQGLNRHSGSANLFQVVKLTGLEDKMNEMFPMGDHLKIKLWSDPDVAYYFKRAISELLRQNDRSVDFFKHRRISGDEHDLFIEKAKELIALLESFSTQQITKSTFRTIEMNKAYEMAMSFPYPHPHFSDDVANHGKSIYFISRKAALLIEESARLGENSGPDSWVVKIGDSYYSLPSLAEVRHQQPYVTPELETLKSLRKRLMNTYDNLRTKRILPDRERKYVNESVVFATE